MESMRELYAFVVVRFSGFESLLWGTKRARKPAEADYYKQIALGRALDECYNRHPHGVASPRRLMDARDSNWEGMPMYRSLQVSAACVAVTLCNVVVAQEPVGQPAPQNRPAAAPAPF